MNGRLWIRPCADSVSRGQGPGTALGRRRTFGQGSFYGPRMTALGDKQICGVNSKMPTAFLQMLATAWFNMNPN